jgi:hypothetical protein
MESKPTPVVANGSKA